MSSEKAIDCAVDECFQIGNYRSVIKMLSFSNASATYSRFDQTLERLAAKKDYMDPATKKEFRRLYDEVKQYKAAEKI